MQYKCVNLALAIVIGAYTLVAGDRPGTNSGYAHYRDGRSDVSPLFFDARVYLALDQFLAGCDGIDAKKTPLPTWRMQQNVDVLVESHGPSVEVAASEQHRLGMYRNSFCVDFESNTDDRRYAFFEGSEDQRCDRRSFDPLRIGFWCTGFGHSQYPRQKLEDHRFGNVVYTVNGSRFGDRALCYSEYVGLHSFNAVVSLDSIKSAAFPSNFAGFRNRLDSVANDRFVAVGCDNDLVRRDKDDERSSFDGLRTKNNTGHKEPQFLRRNDKGGRYERFDLATGDELEIISDADIDVSYDGKRWFHLLGTYCLRHEEPFYSAGRQ